MHRTSSIALLLTALSSLPTFAAMPDLVIDKPLLAASVEIQKATFASSDCAVIESCAPSGNRRLLKFDVGFKNIGNGDLVIGDPNTRPDLFEISPCHGHAHLKGAADYALLNGSGQTVLRARKQAFCFRDNVAFASDAGPAQFTCEFQGITAGWEDIYDKSLDCQWLDITGLAGGTYVLQVTVNPDGVFEESNYGNNIASVSITLPGSTTQPEAPTQPKPKTPTVKKPEPDWKKLADKFKKEKKQKKLKKKKKGKAKGHHKGEHDNSGKDSDGDKD